MLLVKNGRVIDPATKTDTELDILLNGDVIAEVSGPGKISRDSRGAETFDATGLIVAPGFIDLHAHLREPGQESSETIETGTKAAARGGFTAVCCMPNTKPVHDNASVTRFILDKAKSAATRVWPIGAASIGSQGEAIAEIAAMKEAGIVAVSDDGKPIATAKLARQVMDYCLSLGIPVIEHSEDVSLAAGAVMREGITSTCLGLPGMPAAAEAVCVARDVQLVELTGARLHVAHLSARASLDQVRGAKSRGLRVTCEVTPHHFTLTDEAVGDYNTNCKMNPPLRSAADIESLVVALGDGTVDAIATDHAPHASHEKQVEFERAAFGITGLETALGLVITKLHREHRIPLARVVELFTAGPARVFDLQGRGSLARGNHADVTIFDPKKRWTFDVTKSRSLSQNSPFGGWQLTGKIVATIVSGRIVYRAD